MKKLIGIMSAVLVSGAVALAARLRHAKCVATPRRPLGAAGLLVRTVLTLAAGVLVCADPARAGSPARTVGTVATAGTDFSTPASGGMAYKLQAVVFAADTGTTQTVALVQGGITNQLATKAVSATDRMLTVTNAPWLFSGETVRITTSATNAYGVVLVGETGD